MLAVNKHVKEQLTIWRRRLEGKALDNDVVCLFCFLKDILSHLVNLWK